MEHFPATLDLSQPMLGHFKLRFGQVEDLSALNDLVGRLRAKGPPTALALTGQMNFPLRFLNRLQGLSPMPGLAAVAMPFLLG
jgi:hypothetical protein